MSFFGRLSSVFLCFQLLCISAIAQEVLPDAPTPHIETAASNATTANVQPVLHTKPHEQWKTTTEQYFEFMIVLHAFRLAQPKTRDMLGGPFFPQWQQSITAIGDGWNDGDSIFTNDVLHPAQGSVYSYLYLQNQPRDRTLTFANTSAYWDSRLRASAFSFLASTQFEIGPLSEATIGHVGVRPHTQGLTDFVMTPVGGLGMNVLQDWIDKRLIEPNEPRASAARVRFWRTAGNPARSIANLLRHKTPWYRDSRPLICRDCRQHPAAAALSSTPASP